MGWWYPPVVAHDTRASRLRCLHIVRMRAIYSRRLPAPQAESNLTCKRLPNINTPVNGYNPHSAILRPAMAYPFSPI